MSSKIIAIIPARKGSKRLPGKNKRLFCGKPLIEWTVSLALQIKLFNKVIVTTDDQEIIEHFKIASQYKQNLQIIKRPEHLAQDDTELWEVIDHLFFEGIIEEKTIIVLLQPTSPLRNVSDVQKAIIMFIRTREGVIPITKIDEMTYRRCGTVFVDWYNQIFNHQDFREGQFILIPPERAIDIDTLEDFEKAEKIMEERLKS